MVGHGGKEWDAERGRRRGKWRREEAIGDEETKERACRRG